MPRSWLNHRLVRFIFSGALGAGTNLLLLYVLTDLAHWWYLYAGVASFVVSFLVSFVAQKFWTFRDQRRAELSGQALYYLTISLFNLVLNSLILYLLVDHFHLYYLLAQVVASLVLAVSSYFLYRELVFHPEQEHRWVRGVRSVVLNRHYQVLVLIAINTLLYSVFLLHTPTRIPGDTPTYVAGADYLTGGLSPDVLVPLNRLLSAPLFIATIAGLSHFTGDTLSAIYALNFFFYFLSIFVFYHLALQVFQQRRIAFISALLYATTYGLSSFGVNYLADMSGWFFFVLTSLFAMRFFRGLKTRDFVLGLLSTIVGVFFKEYGGLGLITLSLLILFSPLSIKNKLKYLGLAALGLLAALAVYHYWFYLHFHYSYFDWYRYNLKMYAAPGVEAAGRYGLVLMTKVLGWVYLVGWPLFAWGLWRLWQRGERQLYLVLVSLLPASLSFLLWPALTQRIVFVFVPWLILVSAFGVSRWPRWTLVLVVAFYALINYATPWLIPIINLPF